MSVPENTENRHISLWTGHGPGGPGRVPDMSIVGGRSLAAVRDGADHANIATASIYTHLIDDNDDLDDVSGFTS